MKLILLFNLFWIYSVAEEQYQAVRHALTRNVKTILLNETGPAVRLSVLVGHHLYS